MNIFLSILSSNICFGAQMNRLIEMVLLSTHNICFGLEISIEGLNNVQAEIPTLHTSLTSRMGFKVKIF